MNSAMPEPELERKENHGSTFERVFTIWISAFERKP
jgi:hypothetical protein